MIENATFLVPDVQAVNGYIHIIDTVRNDFFLTYSQQVKCSSRTVSVVDMACLSGTETSDFSSSCCATRPYGLPEQDTWV